MRNYIARVLVEHQLTPKPEDYSSFSELIILGKFELPKNVEFSQLLFDESELTIGIINQLLALMTKKSMMNILIPMVKRYTYLSRKYQK